MRVMVLIKATAESEAGQPPTPELLAAMAQYNEALVRAGILLAGDGLKPSRYGKRIHCSGTTRTVTDGPFTATTELVAGFWLWQVRSLEEALLWAQRCPNPMPGDSDIEIRPLFEPQDFL